MTQIDYYFLGHDATISAEPENSQNSFLQQQTIPPFVKDLFIGKFNRSLLSYAEILNEQSYLELEEKVKKGE